MIRALVLPGILVANVFVLAQVKDPVTFDVRQADGRNTLGMMGRGRSNCWVAK